MAGLISGIYLHVPFCPTICPYCDFHALLRSRESVAIYLDRLEAEARELYARFSGDLQTLYLGGGTPSFLRDSEIERLFAALPWQVNGEVTLEVNPGTLNKSRLELWGSLGVNRISLGVQSFQDPVLKALGRAHGRRGALQAVELSLEAGFRTSLDLILGLPGQDYERDLSEAAALGVEHVSAYTLQVEPGTPLALQGIRENPDLEAEAFLAAREILGQAGLERYEVANFARPGCEAQHNLNYWRLGFWGGLGPAASAHLPATAPDYAERLTAPPLYRWAAGEAAARELIGPAQHIRETLMMTMRLAEGLDLATLATQSSPDLAERILPKARELADQGLLQVSGTHISPTLRGMDLNHQVVIALWEALA